MILIKYPIIGLISIVLFEVSSPVIPFVHEVEISSGTPILRVFNFPNKPDICLPDFVRSILFLRHPSMGALVFGEGPVKNLQQPLGKYGAGDDPGVHPSLGLFEIVLAEIQQELEGIVADLKVVAIASIQEVTLFRILVSLSHNQPITPKILLKRFKG